MNIEAAQDDPIQHTKDTDPDPAITHYKDTDPVMYSLLAVDPCARMLRWLREKSVSPYEECSCIFYGDPSSENTLSSLNL